MGEGGLFIVGIDLAAREATLFAAIWFFLGGIDDLLVDFLYLIRRLSSAKRKREPTGFWADAPLPAGRIALFVPAWREERVIADMLRTALARFDHPDYAIYVGTYPNDGATIAAVASVVAIDPRVQMVIGPRAGPTTKADCLNTLWHRLRRDEAADGIDTFAVALHDAEDVVHPLELRLFAHALQHHAAVQLPVLPLPHPDSRFVARHYCDEFAEAHAKQLLVRQALGAGLPFAGVGCAVRRDMLATIAASRGGAPFDATSLTEDYELGLTVSAMGGRTILARVPERPGGRPVAVRAYFPDTLGAAIRQKARWMTGIALAGWDRTGWAAPANLGDHWMRMRDRRVTLAIPVLATGYCALLLWGISLALHAALGGGAPALSAPMTQLLGANLALLGWRLAARAIFVHRAYGGAEAWWSVPRMVVGNYIALLAARRALMDYIAMLAGGAPKWDKTEHQFPADPDGATA